MKWARAPRKVTLISCFEEVDIRINGEMLVIVDNINLCVKRCI